jgi:hypothetical protein
MNINVKRSPIRNMGTACSIAVLAGSLLTSATVLAQGYPAGMISYWKLDEGSGTTAGDSVGGYHGTIQGALWTTGLVHDALAFDGSDDEVAASGFPMSQLAAAGSVEFWIYPNYELTTGIHGFLSTGSSMDWCNYPSEADKRSYRFVQYGEHISFQNSPCGPEALFSTVGMPSNTWHHLAGTWDQGLGRIQVYLNGAIAAEETGLDLGTELDDGFYIGFTHDVNDWHNSGTTDEVAVYDRVLTPEEIEEHYQNGLAGLGYGESPGAELNATSDSLEIYPGDPVSVDLDITNAEDLYAAQAECTVDPAVLTPIGGTYGDFFDPVNRLEVPIAVDPGTGGWVGAVSQANPAGPLSGDGLFATMEFTALAAGTTAVTCVPLLADQDGFELPSSFNGMSITVLAFAAIDGTVFYQGRLEHAGITVTAEGPVILDDDTDSAGGFSLATLKAGSYDIRAEAVLYLPVCRAESLTPGQSTTLPTVSLPGGDLNGDETINIGDASLLGSSFGLDDPLVDINADGIINVQDLAILGGNYELFGCQTW